MPLSSVTQIQMGLAICQNEFFEFPMLHCHDNDEMKKHCPSIAAQVKSKNSQIKANKVQKKKRIHPNKRGGDVEEFMHLECVVLDCNGKSILRVDVKVHEKEMIDTLEKHVKMAPTKSDHQNIGTK